MTPRALPAAPLLVCAAGKATPVPVRPLNSIVRPQMPMSSRDKRVLTLSAICAGLVSAIVLFVVPVWIGMLSGVEDVWPRRTQLLFAGYKFSLAFPLIVLCGWFLWPNQGNRRIVIPALTVLSSIAILAAAWWAGTDADTVLEAVRRTSAAS